MFLEPRPPATLAAENDFVVWKRLQQWQLGGAVGQFPCREVQLEPQPMFMARAHELPELSPCGLL